MYESGSFRSDQAADALRSPAQLLALASLGSELTYTLVPIGSQRRLGINRDGDAYLDADELLAGSDPADAKSIPGACLADIAPTQHDGVVDAQDLAAMLSQWGSVGFADLNDDGITDAADMAILLGAWGVCP